MPRLLLAAAILAAFTAAIHIFAGTPEIAKPLLRSVLPAELRLLLYACWHVVSLALVFSAGALAMAARSRNAARYQPMVRLVSWQWIAFGLVFIAVGGLHSGGTMLLQLPQWMLLLPVGLLGLWGSRRQ